MLTNINPKPLFFVGCLNNNFKQFIKPPFTFIKNFRTIQSTRNTFFNLYKNIINNHLDYHKAYRLHFATPIETLPLYETVNSTIKLLGLSGIASCV